MNTLKSLGSRLFRKADSCKEVINKGTMGKENFSKQFIKLTVQKYLTELNS